MCVERWGCSAPGGYWFMIHSRVTIQQSFSRSNYFQILKDPQRLSTYSGIFLFLLTTLDRNIEPTANIVTGKTQPYRYNQCLQKILMKPCSLSTCKARRQRHCISSQTLHQSWYWRPCLVGSCVSFYMRGHGSMTNKTKYEKIFLSGKNSEPK